MRYTSELAKNYSEKRDQFNETDKLLMESVESVGVKDKNVLDLGCGDGRHANYIKEVGASNVIGIDINENMIEMARKNNLNTPNVSFKVASGDNLLIKDEAVGLIFSNFVLHYFKDSEKVFGEISRVLKEKGFFIGTFNITEVEEGFEYLYNTQMPIKLGTGNDPIVVENLIKSKEEILRAIEDSGLTLIKEEELHHPNAVVDDSFINKEQIKKHAVMMILQKK